MRPILPMTLVWLVLLLVAAPTEAAITSIGSRGTNVAGAGNNTDIAVTPTGTIAAGRIAIIFVAKRQTNAVSGVTDTQNNDWTPLGEFTNATNGNIMVSAWMSRIATQLTTSDSVTVTWGVNENDICAALWEFQVDAGNTLALTTGTTNPITSEVNGADGFGSSAFSGLSSLSRLYLRVAGKQVNSTTDITASGSFTTWALTIRSRNNSNASIARAEHRINTSTGETSNPTLAVSGNTAGLFLALEEVAAPTGWGQLLGNRRNRLIRGE